MSNAYDIDENIPPNLPRFTVRPEGVDRPFNDELSGTPEGVPEAPAWGRPGEGGRPANRLFEPDLTPAPAPSPAPYRPWISYMPSPAETVGTAAEVGKAIGGGLGSLVRGAGSLLGPAGGEAAPIRTGSYAPPTAPPPEDAAAAAAQRLARPYVAAQAAAERRDMPIAHLPGAAIGMLLDPAQKAVQGSIDYMAARRAPEDEQQQAALEDALRRSAEGGFESAANIAGLNAPFSATRAGLGTFGSKMAAQGQPARMAALDLATKMQAQGQTPEKIWRDTGWLFDKAGNPLYEIPDNKAYWRGIPNNWTGTTDLKLSDVYVNNAVFNDYPQLRNVKVQFTNDLPADAAASYVPGNLGRQDYGTIRLPMSSLFDKTARGEMFENILHESMHVIQYIENLPKGTGMIFRRGGKAEDIFKRLVAERATPEYTYEQWADKFGYGYSTERIKSDYAQYLKGLQDQISDPGVLDQLEKQAAKIFYNNSIGEGFAERVPLRKDFSPAQRERELPQPYGQIYHADVPPEHQVFEYHTPYFRGLPANYQPSRVELGFEPGRQPTPTTPLSAAQQQGDLFARVEPGSILNPVPDALRLKKEQRLTGSFDPRANVDVTWNGKQMREWTPQDWKAVGDHVGVPNLGPLSPVQKFRTMDGHLFEVPGGTEGTWTYYDLLHMKANPIDASRLPRDLHIEMQKKLGRTMSETGEVSPEKVWDGLVFGMTSPSNPLFPNQLSTSRMRMRGAEGDPSKSPTINALADSIPWKAGEEVPKEVRDQYNHAIARQFGLQGAPAGGLGTRGSANYTYIAEMAQMFRQHPDWFRKKDFEGWGEFVERLATQTKGLSMKTGSFGGVWQDPFNAAISAIDRHMAREFQKRGGLFVDQAAEDAWKQETVTSWNKARDKLARQQSEKTGTVVDPTGKVNDFNSMLNQKGSDQFLGEKLLEYVGAHGKPGMFTKAGEINPNLPPHLRRSDWLHVPENALIMGDAYKRALAVNQDAANQSGLNLFMSQWLEWDRIRRRFEPHESQFPGLGKLFAPSQRQLQSAKEAHIETGHWDNKKEQIGDVVALRPTKPLGRNPSEMGYLAIPGAVGLGALVAPENYQPQQ